MARNPALLQKVLYHLLVNSCKKRTQFLGLLFNWRNVDLGSINPERMRVMTVFAGIVCDKKRKVAVLVHKRLRYCANLKRSNYCPLTFNQNFLSVIIRPKIFAPTLVEKCQWTILSRLITILETPTNVVMRESCGSR